MKPKEVITKSIPLWIMIIGFIVSGLGGWYGGQLRTQKQFTEVLIIQADHDNYIIQNEEDKKEILLILKQQGETLRNFITVYAANSGVVIEWSR